MERLGVTNKLDAARRDTRRCGATMTLINGLKWVPLSDGWGGEGRGRERLAGWGGRGKWGEIGVRKGHC